MEPIGDGHRFRTEYATGGDMNILAQIHSFVLALLKRSRFRDEIDEELRAHLEDRASDLERSGLSHEGRLPVSKDRL